MNITRDTPTTYPHKKIKQNGKHANKTLCFSCNKKKMTSSFLTSNWLTYFLFVTKVALKNLHFCNNLGGQTVCLIFVFHAFSSDFKCVLHNKIVQCRFLIRIPLLLENLLFSFDEWYIWMAVAINIARLVLIGKIFLN